MHFVAGGLLVIVVFVLQYVPQTMPAGDALRWVCTIFPTYCVTHGILFSASSTLLVDSRLDDEVTVGDKTIIIPRKIPPGTWEWYNLKGDCMILVLHFVFGLILLTLIELEVYLYFDWCPKMGIRTGDSYRRGPQLIKDDDVINEERRVAMQSDDSRASMSMADSERQLLDSNASNGKQDPNHRDCIRVHNFQKEYDTFCGAPIKAV